MLYNIIMQISLETNKNSVMHEKKQNATQHQQLKKQIRPCTADEQLSANELERKKRPRSAN